MENQKVRTLHVRKIKEEPKKEDKIRKITIKKAKPSTDLIHLRVVSFKDFYDKYMKDLNESPREYINTMGININLIYYYMKSTVYEEPEKSRMIFKKLNSFDYVTYMDIFINTSEGKLQHLNMLEPMTLGVRRLYEVFHYLINEKGYILDLKYSLVQLREIIYDKTMFTNLRSKGVAKRRSLRRMVAIKDNVILETADYIEPINKLCGGSIMVEYANNQFLNIPYMYYNRLSKIASVEISYTLNDITDNMQDPEFYEKVELSKEETLCTSIPVILKTCLDFYNRWEAVENMINEAMRYAMIFETVDETASVCYKDGSVQEYRLEDFLNYYMDFILG